MISNSTYQQQPKIATLTACTNDPTTFRHLCLVAPAYFAGTGMKVSLFSNWFNFKNAKKDIMAAQTPGGENILTVNAERQAQQSFSF